MGVSDTISSGLDDLQRFRDPTAEDEEAAIATDEVFHLLQTKRRRDVLRYLREERTAVRMGELAEQVAAWEQGTSVAALSSSERQRVYISLYQSHLPKLEEAGVIVYRKNRGIVERTPLADQLDPYLETPSAAGITEGDRWAGRYVGIAIGSGLALAATASGVVEPDGTVLAALIFAAFSLLALSHLGSSLLPLDLE